MSQKFTYKFLNISGRIGVQKYNKDIFNHQSVCQYIHLFVLPFVRKFWSIGYPMEMSWIFEKRQFVLLFTSLRVNFIYL